MAGTSKKSKVVQFPPNAKVQVRRFEHFRDTKNTRVFGVTEDMIEAAKESGMSEKESKSITGSIYDRDGPFGSADNLYVIISTTKPSNWEDPTEETE